jgi:hypothetical protein
VCDSSTCNPDGLTCAPECTATSCPPGQICAATHHCVDAIALGQTCTTDGECGSGHCVDGVCCDGPCDGVCSSCALPGREGMCKPFSSGTDPEDECSGGETCDGHGACAGHTDGGAHDGGASDAGPRDASAADGGMDDGGTTEPPAQACACSTPGRSTAPAPLGLLLLGLIGMLGRARRRGR